MDRAVLKIVSSVGQLARDEFKLLHAIGSGMVELRDELATMNALLRMHSEAEEGAADHFVQEWMKQLSELAYDTEDCVDLCIYRIRFHKGDSFLVWCKCMIAKHFPGHYSAGKIKALRLRAITISERHAPPVAVVSAQALRPTNVTDRLVGIGEQADSLAEKVKAMRNDQEDKLKVFSIVGFGGLGKTTLAMEVCRLLEPDFHCQAQVSVSQAFDAGKDLNALLKRVYEQMLKSKSENKWLE